MQIAVLPRLAMPLLVLGVSAFAGYMAHVHLLALAPPSSSHPSLTAT
jgi:hypothetical protein